MPRTTLADLVARNARHTDSVPADFFADVEDAQSPAAVSICCADSRVSQEGMWDVTEPGWLFTPSTIGNQVWDCHGDERVVDGSVVYPLAYTDTDVAIVVGHTGCGAVTAAVDAVESGSVDAPPGVEKWIEFLVPIVEDGLATSSVTRDRDVSLVDQLVEYNVDRQVAFLRESDDVPPGTSVYGFVYDFQGVYGDHPGRAYLVNVDGEREIGALREQVPAEFGDHVRRIQ